MCYYVLDIQYMFLFLFLIDICVPVPMVDQPSVVADTAIPLP